MGRIRTIGIKAATVTAASAAALAIIAVPASAAGVGAAIKVCVTTNTDRTIGRLVVVGKNQHKEDTTSPRGEFWGNECIWLNKWWWIAPGVDVVYSFGDDGITQRKYKAISQKDYDKMITVYI